MKVSRLFDEMYEKARMEYAVAGTGLVGCQLIFSFQHNQPRAGPRPGERSDSRP